MKIILDLENSFNNFYWTNKEELKEYIVGSLDILWKFYNEFFVEEEFYDDEVKDRLSMILDTFTSFEIKESDK